MPTVPLKDLTLAYNAVFGRPPMLTPIAGGVLVDGGVSVVTTDDGYLTVARQLPPAGPEDTENVVTVGTYPVAQALRVAVSTLADAVVEQAQADEAMARYFGQE